MAQSSAFPSIRGIMLGGNWKILKVVPGRSRATPGYQATAEGAGGGTRDEVCLVLKLRGNIPLPRIALILYNYMAGNLLFKHLGRLMAACVAVSGLMAAEHHGVVKSGGLPIPGVTITATQADKKTVTTTDDQGAYSFPELADGTWTIEVEMMGFARIARDVGIASDAPPADWDLKLLPPGANLTGTPHAPATRHTGPRASGPSHTGPSDSGARHTRGHRQCHTESSAGRQSAGARQSDPRQRNGQWGPSVADPR